MLKLLLLDSSNWACFFTPPLFQGKNGKSGIFRRFATFLPELFSKLRWSYRVVKIPKDAFFYVDSGKTPTFHFSAFLTTFWSQILKFRFLKIWKWQNLLCAFPTQNWVKSGQNQVKLIDSENWEKMQFFHVSITFVAQELDSLAQIAD